MKMRSPASAACRLAAVLLAAAGAALAPCRCERPAGAAAAHQVVACGGARLGPGRRRRHADGRRLREDRRGLARVRARRRQRRAAARGDHDRQEPGLRRRGEDSSRPNRNAKWIRPSGRSRRRTRTRRRSGCPVAVAADATAGPARARGRRVVPGLRREHLPAAEGRSGARPPSPSRSSVFSERLA